MIGKYTNILFNTSVNLSVKFTKVLLKTVILSITHQKISDQYSSGKLSA